MAASGNKIELILSLAIEKFQKNAQTAIGLGGSIGKTMEKALAGADSAFKRVIASSQAYHKTLKELNGTADHFRDTVLQIGGAIGGGMLFTSAGRSAVSFNSTIEQSRIGIAALVRTFDQSATMNDSLVKAEEIQKRLQIAGLQTTATYQELLTALQEGVGPALREGFNPAQIVKFTQSMTQAAAGLSLPMHQLGQELRAVLDGTIDRNARIAMALQIKNEDIVKWKETGTLFAELENRLKAFSAAGDQSAKTFSGAWSNIQDAVQMALGKANEQAFSKTTGFFLKLKDAIVTVDETAGTFKFNEKIMAALQGVDEKISKLIGSFTPEQITAFAVNFTATMGSVAEAGIQFVGALVKIGEALGPLGPWVAGAVTSIALFGGALKAVIGLPLFLYRQVAGLLAGFKELGGFKGVAWLTTYIKDVQLATKNTGLFQTATFSLGKAMTTLGGVVAAAFIGWEVGKILGQFDPIQTAMVGMIHHANQVGLTAQRMWKQLTGTDADVKAIDEKIALDKQVYQEMLADIKEGKGAGENPWGGKPEPEKQPEAPKKPGESDTPDTQKKADPGYRTPEYLDGLDEAALSPEEIEDRKKRWSEREAQEQQLNSEKNDRIDKVAADNAAEDEKRAAIRAADAKRKADPNSSYYDGSESDGGRELVSTRIEHHVSREEFDREAKQAEEAAAMAQEAQEKAQEQQAPKKKKKIVARSGGYADSGLIRDEIKDVELARKEEVNELRKGMHTLDELDQIDARINKDTAAKFAAKATERKIDILETLRGENEKNLQAEMDAAANGDVFVGKRAVAEFDPAIAALEAAAKENELKSKMRGSGTISEMEKNRADIDQERKAFEQTAKAKKEGVAAAQKAAEVEYQARVKMADLEKVLADEAKQRNDDLEEAAKKAVSDRLKAEEDATTKAKSIFEKYAERVKALQEEIAGRERSLADELSALDPHATEEQRWRRKAKAAADYEKAAKAAMAAGRLDDAREYADQAKTTYAGLKDGGGRISDKLADRTAFSGVRSAGTLGVQISKMISDAAAKAAKAGISGIDGLNSRVAAQLQRAVSGMAAAPTGPGKQATQVHEIKLGNARLQGSENDVADFIRQLELAGMRA